MIQLKLAVDNGAKDVTNLSADEIASVHEVLKELPFHERTQFLEKLMQPLIPAFQTQITSPTWLVSDFDAPVWECMFEDKKKTIDFNICLEDGIALTAPKHNKLLYTLKYWYCSQSHPRYCGGKNLKPSTAYNKVMHCLRLTDALLLRSNHFQLSKHGLKLFTENDALALLECTLEGVVEGLYQTIPRVTKFLLHHIKSVTNESVISAAEKHPDILRTTDETSLGLTDKQIVKARVWLLNQGAFHVPGSSANAGACNSSFFKQHIYTNILHDEGSSGCHFPELRVTPLAPDTEYHAIPINNRDESGTSIQCIVEIIQTLRSLNAVTGDDFVGPPPESIERLSLKHLTSHFKFKELGRFRTLPAPVVFTALKDAFEFCFKYMDTILENMEKYHYVLRSSPKQKLNGVHHQLRDAIVQNNITPTLQELGIQRWLLRDTDNNTQRDPEFYNKLRGNEGFAELYEVLMGSVQIIVGTLMARRVSEIYSLKADCLHPKSDPTDPENENTNYSIEFYNRKSGAGHKREKLIRPLPKVGAQLIWKLQQFRHEMIKMEVIPKSSKLLLGINRKTGRFVPVISNNLYNQHFDTFCDYFETALVKTSPNEFRRYYIRQHQLRRFFAMSFFWSSGFDGLDTLRYFLGHTDAEQLYHYITENTPGEVLRGVKAETLVHGLNTDKIAGIEKLREILKERYEVQDVTVEALEDSIDELQHEVEDGYIKTTPELEKLRGQLEKNVDELLSKGVIDLHPHFCTVQDETGEVTQEITLVLTVNEVENDSDQ